MSLQSGSSAFVGLLQLLRIHAEGTAFLFFYQLDNYYSFYFLGFDFDTGRGFAGSQIFARQQLRERDENVPGGYGGRTYWIFAFGGEGDGGTGAESR